MLVKSRDLAVQKGSEVLAAPVGDEPREAEQDRLPVGADLVLGRQVGHPFQQRFDHNGTLLRQQPFHPAPLHPAQGTLRSGLGRRFEPDLAAARSSERGLDNRPAPVPFPQQVERLPDFPHGPAPLPDHVSAAQPVLPPAFEEFREQDGAPLL